MYLPQTPALVFAFVQGHFVSCELILCSWSKMTAPLIAEYKSIIIHLLLLNVVLDFLIHLTCNVHNNFLTSICHLGSVGLTDTQLVSLFLF